MRAVRYLAMGLDIVHGDCIWVEIVAWERLLGHDRPVVSVPAVYKFLNIRKNDRSGSARLRHDL